MLFYVLDFTNHSFATHHTAKEVVCSIEEKVKACGIYDSGNFEIIICTDDVDMRLSIEEFQNWLKNESCVPGLTSRLEDLFCTKNKPWRDPNIVESFFEDSVTERGTHLWGLYSRGDTEDKSVLLRWVDLGEGSEGDFEPEAPDQESYLRLDVVFGEFARKGRINEPDDSFCTRVVATATEEEQKAALACMVRKLQVADVRTLNFVCSQLSHFSLTDLEDLQAGKSLATLHNFVSGELSVEKVAEMIEGRT